MTKDVAALPEIQKRVWLILCTTIIWGVLVFVVIWHWAHQFDRLNLRFSILAHISAFIWWAVLLWALHHLSFQLGALFKKHTKVKMNLERPSVIILYTTCDDFDPTACRSCVQQKYEKFRVLICDDSKKDEFQQQVKEFESSHQSKCTVITRPNQQGFKAGNLNNAIDKEVEEDWILLVDADQVLPPDYLSKFVARLPEQVVNIAFVQAAHQAINDSRQKSYFQNALSPEIALYYSRDLTLRESFGFVPLLGHGAMIRKVAWQTVGKFPEIVSEDFGFALRASNHLLQGRYIDDVVSEEALPHDFGGFIVRLKKFAGGTAELLRSEAIIRGKAHFVEKWDFLMMLLWYVLMPFVTFNGFLGAYVCHKLWSEGFPYLHPVLPYLYSWMLLTIFVLNLSVSQSFGRATQFYFWSTAIYTAAMPTAGLSFIKHMFTQPSFKRTPKNHEETPLDQLGLGFMCLLGISAVICSLVWLSPFTPLLLGQGIAYLSYPLYGKLCLDSRLGALSRMVVYLPGSLMLLALYTMWTWGRY
jgi:cellulose synthase/poly-beta-1,6-N-acetylglucosamine synthase-like glycosyltransferase